MARPQKQRNVCSRPKISCFQPGNYESDEFVRLAIDQYETLRLIDYEKLTQEECALRMNVARTTIQAIYDEARFIIADALVNGKRIVIEGGNVSFCNGDKLKCGNFFRGCPKRIINNLNIELKTNQRIKIATTYEDDKIYEHFGHSKYFKIYDVLNGKVISSEIVATPIEGHISSIEFLKKNKVDVLICGGIGSTAKNYLEEVNIKLYGGVNGNCDEVVEQFLTDNLKYNSNISCRKNKCEK